MKKPLHSILPPDYVGRFVASSFHLPGPLACRLLISGVNEIYLVESEGSRYIARLSRVKRYRPHNEDAYRFELEALRFLHDRHIPVSPPIEGRDTTPLAVLEAPEGKRYCSLFAFAPGKPVYPLDTDMSFTAGAMLAKIHTALDDFTTNLERFHLDLDFLLDRPVELFEGYYGEERPEDFAFLCNAANDCKKNLAGLGNSAGEHGLIHGDYWWQNFHFTEEGHITVFDFDAMGRGRRVFDLACMTASDRLFGNRMSGDAIDVFYQGYQSIRPLSDDEIFSIPYLEKARLILSIGRWISFMDTMGLLYFEPRINRALQVLANLYE